MAQRYFSRILEDAGKDFDVAFRREGHIHLGYYNGAANDASVQAFAAAAHVLAQRVFTAARIADGMRVLDVGCGLGGSLAKLNEERSRVDLVGLNIDGRQLDMAHASVKARPTNRVSFVEGDGTRLPFSDASFDALISIECVELLPSRRQFFREARRVLRPGGRLCISDYVPQAWALPPLAVLMLIVERRLNRFFGELNPWPCTPLGYRFLGNTTGFREVQDEEMTRNVLPSFAALRNIFADRESAQALAALEWFCRRGMVNYRILTFA